MIGQDLNTVGLDRVRERLGQNPVFCYDEGDIYATELEYLTKEQGLSQSEAEESIYNDPDLYSQEWEFFLSEVQEWLDKLPEDKIFYIEARGLGWRNLTGSKILYADSASDFISGLVGMDCEYTLRAWESDTCLLDVTVSHHDSPTGESRMVYSLPQYVKKQVDSFTIQKLQQFLTAYRWVEYYSPDDTEDEYYTDKPRRFYTKDDFCTLFLEWFKEGEIDDSQLFDIAGMMKYYIEEMEQTK